MSTLHEEPKVYLEGHVKIIGYDTPNEPIVLLDKRNAIHQEHASIIIASALANRTTDGSIFSMYFGTGGATIDNLGEITYAAPTVTGAADLHVPVYFEVVDDNLGAPVGNQMSVKHVNGTTYSDVEIRAVIAQNEPFGQSPTDTITGTNINTGAFIFDEIGLKTQGGLLFSHVVFSPIEKSANRIIEVVYTVRVTVAI